MPEFVFTHRFPNGFTGGPETRAAAIAWFQQLGNSVVGRSDPMFETRRFGDCGAETAPPAAYTVVRADSAEAAAGMASTWPLLSRGGGVEVRQLTSREIDLTVRP